MFEILSKIIYEESGIQILHSQKYIDLYRLHYSDIFETISTDEISILNKEIIDIKRSENIFIIGFFINNFSIL